MKHGLNNKNNLQGPLGLVVTVILFTLALGFMSTMMDQTSVVHSLKYSDLIKSIESEHVESIELAGDFAVGKFKNGDKFQVKIDKNNKNKITEPLMDQGADVGYSDPIENNNIWQLATFGVFIAFLLGIWFMKVILKIKIGMR